MLQLLIIVHVLVCLLLILLVLVQNDKGGGLGALSGNASNNSSSGTGAATFISKVTTWVAISFMVIVLFINFQVSRNTVDVGDSVAKELEAGQGAILDGLGKQKAPAAVKIPAKGPATAAPKATAPVPAAAPAE